MKTEFLKDLKLEELSKDQLLLLIEKMAFQSQNSRATIKKFLKNMENE